MHYAPVTTKPDFVRRYMAGEFGNHSPSWQSLEALEADQYSGGLVHLRNRIAGGPTHYDLTVPAAGRLWHQQSKPEDWYCSAMAPTAQTLFQGEVMQSTEHLTLTYSLLPLTMRAALAEQCLTADGIIGVGLLRHYLCPNSYDWLNVLLERYPSHVIEFSTYSVQWGTLPGYNSVVWEVRRY